MRLPIEDITIINGGALSNGNRVVFSKEFPMGEGYYEMVIDVILTLVVGTGSGAISEGELNYIKEIRLTSDIDGLHFAGCGRALYRRAQHVKGITPDKDAIAASNGTYHVHVPLTFVMPLLMRPEDTILDTGRYRSLELAITCGTVADLLTTVGTATVTPTVNVTITKTKGALAEGGRPIAIPYVHGLPIIDPSVDTYVDIERASDLAITMLHILTTNSRTAGVPFSGTPNNAVLADLSFRDNFNIVKNRIPVAVNRNAFARSLNLISGLATGWFGFEFIQDASVKSAYPTGDKSLVRLEYNVGTLSSSGVSVLVDGVRAFKEVR